MAKGLIDMFIDSIFDEQWVGRKSLICLTEQQDLRRLFTAVEYRNSGILSKQTGLNIRLGKTDRT